jgi:hypothetical protein
MNNKHLASAIMALGLVAGVAQAVSVDNPMITVVNNSGKEIKQVRVKVCASNAQGEHKNGSCCVANLAADAQVTVDASKLTKWVRSTTELTKAKKKKATKGTALRREDVSLESLGQLSSSGVVKVVAKFVDGSTAKKKFATLKKGELPLDNATFEITATGVIAQ